MQAPPISKLPTLRQWDRLALYTALAGIIALAWWYLVDMAADMSNMKMPASAMASTAMMPAKSWSLQTFIMMFLMWSIMMVGMMVPSATRTLMVYARVIRQACRSPVLPTLTFLCGYLVIWTAFSLLATLVQSWMNQQALVNDMMVATNRYLIAALFIMAGVYQLTPLKQACLKHCQSPVGFISQHFKAGYAAAIRMGLHHGLYCLGCCWLLMMLLFAAGVMNLLWVLIITLYVFFEKLIPASRYSAFLSAVLMISTGTFFLFTHH